MRLEPERKGALELGYLRHVMTVAPVSGSYEISQDGTSWKVEVLLLIP